MLQTPAPSVQFTGVKAVHHPLPVLNVRQNTLLRPIKETASCVLKVVQIAQKMVFVLPAKTATLVLKPVLIADPTAKSAPTVAIARPALTDSIFPREDASRAFINVIKQHPKLPARAAAKENSKPQFQMSTPATLAL